MSEQAKRILHIANYLVEKRQALDKARTRYILAAFKREFTRTILAAFGIKKDNAQPKA